MPIEFDPINKYILITSPTKQLTALNIYNAVMDWCGDQETISYTIPMKAVGKFPIGAGINSDSIFILINGWKIKFWSGTYQARITGTLITDDESERTVPPDSGNVEITFQVSSQGTVVGDIAELQGQCETLKTVTNEIQGQVLTVEEQTENIDARTLQLVSDILKILKIHEGRWQIKNNQLIIYNPDGQTVYKRFNLLDKTGKPSEKNIYERVPA